jgi:excisionase family DNA binding protein
VDVATRAELPVRLLLRVGEAAERLGISRSQTFKLVWAGELKSVRIGRAVRIPTTALGEYVERLIAR